MRFMTAVPADEVGSAAEMHHEEKNAANMRSDKSPCIEPP